MDFEDAHRVGAAGEREVSKRLLLLSHEFGFRFVDDVLLRRGSKTAQVDHIVVDRRGVLAVETKVRQGALIKGNSFEHRWTACYPGGKNKPFQNPLKQNEVHLAMILETLLDAGLSVSPDHLKGLVVFVGAKTDELVLDSRDQERLTTPEGLNKYFLFRRDFAMSGTELTGLEIDRITEALRASNRTGVEDDEARHAANVHSASPNGRAASAPSERRTERNPRSGYRDTPVRDGRYAAGNEGLLMRLGASLRESALKVLAAVAMLLLMWWVFAGGGLWGVLTLMGQPQLAAPFAPASVPASPSASTAYRMLQQYAPQYSAAVTNPSAPRAARDGANTLYTWDLGTSARAVDPQSPPSGGVRAVTIALTSAGGFAGLSFEK